MAVRCASRMRRSASASVCPRRASFCSASWATASASRSTSGHSAAKSPAALFTRRSCTFASMPSSVGAAARSCSRRSRALRSASSAKGRRWLPPPDSFQGAATLTSWSWRRVAPAPKRESRPKAMTRAMPSWGLRTTVTRERSCDDHPCARKRPRTRCTTGCDRWRCATPELMRVGRVEAHREQRPLAPLPRRLVLAARRAERVERALPALGHRGHRPQREARLDFTAGAGVRSVAPASSQPTLIASRKSAGSNSITLRDSLRAAPPASMSCLRRSTVTRSVSSSRFVVSPKSPSCVAASMRAVAPSSMPVARASVRRSRTTAEREPSSSSMRSTFFTSVRSTWSSARCGSTK
jgi:hypothetical protein